MNEFINLRGVEYLALTAGIIGFTAIIPQLIKMHKTKDVENISILFMLIYLLSFIVIFINLRGVEYLALTVGIIGFAAMIPQLIKIHKTKDVENISILFMLMYLLSSLLLLVYYSSKNIVIPKYILYIKLLLIGIMISQYYYYKKPKYLN